MIVTSRTGCDHCFRRSGSFSLGAVFEILAEHCVVASDLRSSPATLTTTERIFLVEER